MKTSTLHITNGDTTTKYLKKLHFSGDFITWREMCCEGKTTTDVGSESFWKNRYIFFKDTYKVSKQKFVEYTLKEYRNLCNKKESKEIVLWFNYDLSCQINMLAVISWLKTYRKGYLISLVCSSKVKSSKKLKSLPELTKNQITQHYKDRIHLSQDDIEYADYIWQLYCSDSPLRLETIYKFNPMSPFQHLAKALETHLQRFPSLTNGLNNEENFILQTANSSKISTKKQFINTLIQEQEIFGFADLQYQVTLERLKKSFSSFNPVKLSKKGNQLLANQINFYGELRSEDAYLGGAKKYSFLFNNQSKKLLQITS